MNHYSIRDMKKDDEIHGYYIVSSVRINTSCNGNPYALLRVQDAGGAINAIFFSPCNEIANVMGKVVYLSGHIGIYQSELQLSICNLRLADSTDSTKYSLANLLFPPAQPLDDVYHRLCMLIEGIRDEDYRKVCLLALDKYRNEIYEFPAGKTVHHNRRGGLAAHMVGVITLAQSVAYYYPAILNMSLVTAGAFMHDIGKVSEFRVSPLGLFGDYTSSGELLDHSALGLQVLTELALETELPDAKRDYLSHIIASHHAQSGTAPRFPEAAVIAMVDNLDSCLDTYQQELLCKASDSITPNAFLSGFKRSSDVKAA